MRKEKDLSLSEHRESKGFAHILGLLLLLIGLVVAVVLVGQQTNFLPKAYNPVSSRFNLEASPSGTPKCSTNPCAYDLKKDSRNQVNASDYAILSSCSGKPLTATSSAGTSCALADFNGDGNINQTDADCLKSVYLKSCTATPNPTPQAAKRVFITSNYYNGNLGGLTGADAKCQARANTANLGGTWKAWLSDNSISASSRLDHNNGSYQRIDGKLVANNWADLIGGNLLAPINITELNTVKNSSWVWTNSNKDGTIRQASDTSCSNWASDSSGGATGDSSRVDSGWTDYGMSSCIDNRSLYCFEQNSQTPTPSPSLTPVPTNDFGLSVDPASLDISVYQNKFVNIFNMTAARDVRYNISGYGENKTNGKAIALGLSPYNGNLGKDFTIPISLRVGGDVALDTYSTTITIKNVDNNKLITIPAKIKVNPSVNYQTPTINSISVSDPTYYGSQQVHVIINGSGFNYLPSDNPNDPVYTGGLYRSLNFRDSRGIVTQQIVLPSSQSLINDSWTDTIIEKKFVNKITYLEAYIEVYFRSAGGGKMVIATSNTKRVF